MLHPKEWVSKYGDYLYSIAYYKTNSKEAAEDLVQDTFFSALRAIDTFKQNSSEKTWLIAILKNKIIDYYRKRDVLKHTEDYIKDTEDSFYDAFFQADQYSTAHWKETAMPKPWITEADAEVNTKEFMKALDNCIEKMPLKLRPIFVMKYINEEDSEKICKDYGISSSNYWTIIHRAKLILRNCLEKTWFKTEQNIL